jgi:hypothetical protein
MRVRPPGDPRGRSGTHPGSGVDAGLVRSVLSRTTAHALVGRLLYIVVSRDNTHEFIQAITYVRPLSGLGLRRVDRR